MALTTPKTGSDVREDLKALGRRIKGKAGELGEEAAEAWGETKSEARRAAKDVQQGVQDAVQDFHG
jgi:gas vesicle protein